MTCEGEGANLVSILDLGENDFVWVMAQEKEFANTWIGLNSREV